MSSSPTTLHELLLNTKALSERSEEAQSVLTRIMRLEIEGWSEADVRAEIVDPLVRILGYDKESYFSLEREKTVKVLGGFKVLDYSMTLFAEDFWLIEAKRPDPKSSFDRDALYQALRYAAHPDVNAALLMLCDGNKIEVFDRELTLDAPVLSIARLDFDRDFDKLRALLSPWQAWFFEKRRVLRLIDKTFSHETNLGRLEEFRAAIDRRLVDKRALVLENHRTLVNLEVDRAAYDAHLEQSDAACLVETSFFVSPTEAELDAMAANLVARAIRAPYEVMYRIFPDHLRPANAAYWMSALNFLATLWKAKPTDQPVPTFLSHSGRTLQGAMEHLITLCLTAFDADQDRKIILLYAAASRRMGKLTMLLDNRIRDSGDLLHALQRAVGEELSFAQAVSSPERHRLLMLEPLELRAMYDFVNRHTDERHTFRSAAARSELRALWKAELKALQNVPNYRDLAEAKFGGEIFPTEVSFVVYDNLGHNALCVLERHPVWKAWVLQEHRQLVVDLAALGSWQAMSWLDIDHATGIRKIPDRLINDRFFYGDADLARSLREGYGWIDAQG